MLETVHVGPHVYSFGGTQSVIRTIRDHQIGADRIEVLPTWDGPDQWKNMGLTLRAARRIARLPKRTVVHFHISNGGAWLREGPLIALARRRGLPVVIHLHGFEFPEFAASRPRFVKAILGQADHVICLSDEAKDTILGLIPSAQVSVLANPVGIDHEAPPVKESPPVALFAGAIGKRKGVDVLVDAWRQLLEEGIDGTLRVVGPIFDYDPPRLAQMTLEDAVHPDAVPALLREARVVVLPSRAEAMPMILTESLAAGRPFIATPVGGTRMITPDEEMIVPVDDPEALAAAIGRYLRDVDAAAAAGRRGQQHIIETRSPEVIDARLREIYRRILP